MNKKLKIGIIGSSGYLGSNLSLYLEKKHTIKKGLMRNLWVRNYWVPKPVPN